MRQYTVNCTVNACAFPADALQRLVTRRSPDAALLWMAMAALNGQASDARLKESLGWNDERFDSAASLLQEIGAVSVLDDVPAPRKKPEPEVRYAAAEIARGVQADKAFAWAVSETENRVGRVLNRYESETLFYIYDYLKLPADVIVALVSHIAKLSGGTDLARAFRFSDLRAQAKIWASVPIRTTEEAGAYLEQQAQHHSRMREIARQLGIDGRRLSREEEKHIGNWIEWDVPAELIEQAYEKTVARTGRFTIAYLSKILESWHRDGVRSANDAERSDAARRPVYGSNAAALDAEQADYDRMWKERKEGIQ